MIGIYRITNPKGKIYIGQSIDISKRFYRYKKLSCKSQPRIYMSLLKYGVENHKFEIIDVCLKEELNYKEIFYIELYNSTSREKGLNCTTGGNLFIFNDETKLKMSLSAKGRPSIMKGKKHTIEAREKMSLSKKGKVSPRRGAKLTESMKEKIRAYQLGVKQSEETKQKRIKTSKGKINCKKIIDTKTGIIYNSITQAAEIIGVKQTTLNAWLTGQNKNNSNFKYY